LLPKFEQFMRERQYLHNVSPATVSWHTHNLKWLPSETPTEDELIKADSPCVCERRAYDEVIRTEKEELARRSPEHRFEPPQPVNSGLQRTSIRW
jgi:hypothetical protein